MSTQVRPTHEDLDYERIEKIKRIYRTQNDEEFTHQICKQIVEMIYKGEKVYVTNRAAEILRPTLEKYGIVLVPAPKVEYPSILIDMPVEGKITITFHEGKERELKRIIQIETFLKILEDELKKRKKGRKELLVLTLN